MSTSLENDIEHLFDLDSPVACDECDNIATLVRRHDGCSILNCAECKEYVQGQFLLCDDDERFWCYACELSEPLPYWIRAVKWVEL